MKRVLSSVVVMLALAIGLQAQSTPDAAELTKLLKEFLGGASRNDAAIHDRFWAEDLIYTGSSGRRVGKADIMRGLRAAPAAKPGAARTVYDAEDIRIQQYGDTAIIAFRLVARTERDGRTDIAKYLNSGTFLKREGKWQVVNWQATKMPRPEEDARKEVSAAEAAFHKALLAADLKSVESMTDESFVWSHRTGEQVTRQQLLDQMRAGKLKYSKLDTDRVTISVYGDTAVVRGISPRQSGSVPGSGAAEAAPSTAIYTLTFINTDGVWKLVAMHASQVEPVVK